MKTREALMTRLAHWAVQHPKLILAFILIYVISPVDLVPEALVGPLGYADDFLVFFLPFLARAYLRRHTATPYETTAKEE